MQWPDTVSHSRCVSYLSLFNLVFCVRYAFIPVSVQSMGSVVEKSLGAKSGEYVG